MRLRRERPAFLPLYITLKRHYHVQFMLRCMDNLYSNTYLHTHYTLCNFLALDGYADVTHKRQ